MAFDVLIAARERWIETPLMTFHDQAVVQDSGIAFDAIRLEGGARVILVLCTTDENSIQDISQQFKPDWCGHSGDWNLLSVFSLVSSAARSSLGFDYSGMIGPDGACHAITFVGANPAGVAFIERMFQLAG